jgi:uncharacterized protein
METETCALGGTVPGQSFDVTFLHFGVRGSHPKTYIQAGLHADEAPGMLAAHHLRLKLAQLELQGQVRGHIVLVPLANPVGLGQSVLGTHHGRFSLSDGINFNRSYPDLAIEAGDAVAGRLGADAARNGALVREALKTALASRTPAKLTDRLKHALLGEAIDADLVLDLHCDGEAVLHLYILSGQEEVFQPLADCIGARAMLAAEVSGDNPFDEAVSRPWREIAARFVDKPFQPAGLATTLELRGEADVSHPFAAHDAQAIIQFLALRGQLALDVTPAAARACHPTPLAGVETLEAPVSGVVVYLCQTGEHVEPGQAIVEIVDPASGKVTPVCATISGVFFARPAARFALAGRRIGKIAGSVAFRNGNLLSP